MNRLSAGAAIASLALASSVVSGAVAKPSKGVRGPKPPHSYFAALQPVQGATATGPTGHAELNDGKKNDKISIHVRGLQPGVTYTWHLHRQVVCIAAPCNAPEEPGWAYEPLTANPAGNANAKGVSFTFSADPAATYFVDVHDPSGAVIAQGVFAAKKDPGKPATGPSGPRPPKAKGPKH
jgi:hypothetical protein